MPEHTPWQASQTEQRTAWSLAGFCMIVVLIASLHPQWFDFPRIDNNSSSQQSSNIYPTEPRHHMTQPEAPQKPANHHREKEATPPAASPPSAETKSPVTAKPNMAKQMVHPSQALPAQPAAGYYIQLGAFKEYARAQGLADRLSHLGWPSQIIVRGQLHAVWAGPASTRAKAKQLQQAIAAKLRNKGFIIQQGT